MNPSPTIGDSAIGSPRNAFTRPGVLIGGAAGLVALAAIATVLVLRPSASREAAPALAAQSVAAPTTRSATPPEAPADFPEKAAPPSPAVAGRSSSVPRAAPKPAPVQAPGPHSVAKPAAAQQAAAPCGNCGRVESVSAVQKKGEGTGLGAVGGAVVGGLVGSQIGGGSGKNAMAVLGAVGGGVAGHEVEKRARATTVYQVRVRMDDGTLRTITQGSAPTVGQNVTVEGSTLRASGS